MAQELSPDCVGVGVGQFVMLISDLIAVRRIDPVDVLQRCLRGGDRLAAVQARAGGSRVGRQASAWARKEDGPEWLTRSVP
jgi:hypothetical protein